MKKVKYFEESDLLVKRVRKTIKNAREAEQGNKKVDFLACY